MFDKFRLTDEEYEILEKKFGDLCKFEAWQLKRRNSQNNFTDDIEDIVQDLRIAMLRAGVYYKRQVYIEDCLIAAWKHATTIEDQAIKKELRKLRKLWKNKTRHGAHKQKFGEAEESKLNAIVRKIVPFKERPNPKSALRMDAKFTTYCKNVTWNQQKNLGKKITKERSIRTGLISLSDFSNLATAI